MRIAANVRKFSCLPLCTKLPIFGRAPPESRKVADDYLGDMDLPSSESESDEEMPVTRTDDKKDQIRMTQVALSIICKLYL